MFEVKHEVAKEVLEFLKNDENRKELVSKLIDDDDFCGCALDNEHVSFNTKGEWDTEPMYGTKFQSGEQKHDIIFQIKEHWNKHVDICSASQFFADDLAIELRDFSRDQLETDLDEFVSKSISAK